MRAVVVVVWVHRSCMIGTSQAFRPRPRPCTGGGLPGGAQGPMGRTNSSSSPLAATRPVAPGTSRALRRAAAESRSSLMLRASAEAWARLLRARTRGAPMPAPWCAASAPPQTFSARPYLLPPAGDRAISALHTPPHWPLPKPHFRRYGIPPTSCSRSSPPTGRRASPSRSGPSWRCAAR